MKVTIIENGLLKMVCVPITGIDKEAIQAFKNKTLKATYMSQPTSILDVPAPDALVLTVLEDTPIKEAVIPEVDILISPDNTYIGVVEVKEGKSNIQKIIKAVKEWLQDDIPAVVFNESDNLVVITEADGQTTTVQILRTIPR
jgi:hypothetical protein